MGGVGSGRYCRWSDTTTVEEVKRVDIRFMRRRGLLRPNSFGTLSWTRGGEQCGFISYEAYHDHLILDYRFRCGGGEWEPVRQAVYFDRTPCRYGGDRLWFICPSCRRRCEVLCLADKWPACRKCYRLPYQSQCEDRLARLQRRQDRLEAMLWGNKQKWWRKAKRERLEVEWERVTMAANEVFVLAAANLLGEAEIKRLFAD